VTMVLRNMRRKIACDIAAYLELVDKLRVELNALLAKREAQRIAADTLHSAVALLSPEQGLADTLADMVQGATATNGKHEDRVKVLMSDIDYFTRGIADKRRAVRQIDEILAALDCDHTHRVTSEIRSPILHENRSQPWL
jgi:hypothetical protein